MNHEPDRHPDQTAAPPFWRSRYALGLLGFGAMAAYFLLSEHRAHFLGALPFLVLLACPLIHVFMHRGHAGHGGHGDGSGGGHADHTGGRAGPPVAKTGEQP